MTSASASVTTSSVRQSPGAQPRSVTNACPISSSVPPADRATTASSPSRAAAAATRTPSTVRRFLRPGSAGTSRARMAMAERLPQMAQSVTVAPASLRPTACGAAPSSLRSLERDALPSPTHRPGWRLGRRRARQARRSRAQPRCTRHVRPQPAAHAGRSTGSDRVSRAGAGGRRDRRRVACRLCRRGPPALLRRGAHVGAPPRSSRRPVRVLRPALARRAGGGSAQSGARERVCGDPAPAPRPGRDGGVACGRAGRCAPWRWPL